MAMQLTGAQRKYLRGLAHHLNPGAFVGAKGLTQALTAEIEAALDGAELIKIKFVDHKDKTLKTGILDEISLQTGAAVAGMVGHVAVLYRPHKNKDKRRIALPWQKTVPAGSAAVPERQAAERTKDAGPDPDPKMTR